MLFRIASCLVLPLLSLALFFAVRGEAHDAVLVAYGLGIALTVGAQFWRLGRCAFLCGIVCIGTAIWHQPNLMVWFYLGDGGELYPVASGRESLGLLLTGVWAFVVYGRVR